MPAFHAIQEAHQIYRAARPKAGDTVTYEGKPAGTVVRVEDNICHTETEAGPSLFIWAFRDGLNSLHNWPTRKNGRTTAERRRHLLASF